MQHINYKTLDLSSEFGKLLSEKFPPFKKVQPGLISILKAHGETNLSNLLAFMLNGQYHSVLKDIMSEALLDSVDEGISDDILENLFGEDFDVQTEYITNLGNRIDILLIKKAAHRKDNFAVVIENKLYHSVYNDFDDYFYSVCQNEEIRPSRVIFILLELRQSVIAPPSNMRFQKITHENLKEKAWTPYQRVHHQLNGHSASLILTEYFRHIDDLYFRTSDYDNDKALEFYNINKRQINYLVALIRYIEVNNTYAQLPEAGKKFLFENRTAIDAVINLHKGVVSIAEDSFENFQVIQNRKSIGNKGDGYFRGMGEAHEAIRYELNFNGHFLENTLPVKFSVWLNETFLGENGINVSGKEITDKLIELGITTERTTNDKNWVKIHYEEFEADETVLKSLLKGISDKWGGLEDTLIQLIQKAKTQKMNHDLRIELTEAGWDLLKNSEVDNVIEFYLFTHHVVCRLRLVYIFPDYVELFVFVDPEYWSLAHELCENSPVEVVKFNRQITVTLPELKDEETADESQYFDALLKKGIRLKRSQDELRQIMHAVGLLRPLVKEIEVKIEGELMNNLS